MLKITKQLELCFVKDHLHKEYSSGLRKKEKTNEQMKAYLLVVEKSIDLAMNSVNCQWFCSSEPVIEKF